MSATLTTVSSEQPTLRLARAAPPSHPPQPAARQPVPPALVARKVRDLADLETRLADAAASCHKRADDVRAASYASQAAAVRAELAQWNVLAAASAAASPPLASASSRSAALCVLVLPLVSVLVATGHSVARRRAAQAGLVVLACVLLVYALAASAAPLDLPALHSLALSLSLPSCAECADDERACAAAQAAAPRHWANALAPEVLRRKQGATPDLTRAMQTRR